MGKRKLIFVTNDDGYQAKGFRAAIEVARQFGDVIAIGPEYPQSGKSQSITLDTHVIFKTVEENEHLKIYTLSGTPVDCVKFAFDHLFKDMHIDMVISGINHGTNSAVNVMYSGTMGAAIEGAFYGIPAVGLSLTDFRPDADFSAAIAFGKRIVESIFAQAVPPSLCLNVNVPAIPEHEIKGVRVCRQTRGFWKESFPKYDLPHERTCYWVDGAFQNQEPEAEDTDEWALKHGYIAIVPVQADMTAYDKMDTVEKLL